MDYERDGKITLSLVYFVRQCANIISVCLCRVKREQCERDVLLVILCIVVTANNNNNKCNSQTERETITIVQRLRLCKNTSTSFLLNSTRIGNGIRTIQKVHREPEQQTKTKYISLRISYIRILPDAFSLLLLSLVKSKVFYPRKRAHRIRTYSTYIGA